MHKSVEIKIPKKLENIKELQELIPLDCVPDTNFLSRFRVELEYDNKRDILLVWEEWKHTPVKDPLRSYSIVLKLKDCKNSADSTVVELWVEKKVSKRTNLMRCTDMTPISALLDLIKQKTEVIVCK